MLSEDEDVPFRLQDSGGTGTPADYEPGGALGPQVRQVDSGVDVIDLAAMRESLEADRDRRAKGR